MFESCTTLYDLNNERITRIRGGENPSDINKAFNQRKKELLQSRPMYSQVPYFPGKVPIKLPMTYLMVAGTSGDANTVIYRDDNTFLI